MAARLFISYSHKDQTFRDALDEHLAPLVRDKLVEIWHDRKLSAGDEWKGKIDRELKSADIVVLLVSSSFIASDYCFDVELSQAIERHEAGQTVVVPVILRPCDWHRAPFAKLQALPEDGKPVASWAAADEGFLQVAQGIRAIAERFAAKTRRRADDRPKKLMTMPELLAQEMTRLDEAHSKSAHVTGIPTGFIDLDEMCDGLQRGCIHVVASRPLMGKSTFLLNIVNNVAARQSIPTALFSLRMSASEATRLIAADLSGVRRDAFQRGRLAAADWDRLGAALAVLNEAPLFMDDSGELSVSQIRSRIKEAKVRAKGISLIAIDNLHLIKRGTGDRRSTTAVARQLRDIARESDCAVLVTLPVSRAVEARPNKRPVFRDMDEWAVLEEEANVLWFLYRDEIYWDDSPDRGFAELIIAKNDFGGLGTVRLAFQDHLGGFSTFQGSEKS